MNSGNSLTYGYSVTAKTTIKKGVTISPAVDVYRKDIVAPIAFEEMASVQYNGFSANLNAEYTINKRNSISFTASYVSENYTVFQSFRPEITSDFQYSHSLKNGMGLTLNVINAGVPQTFNTWFVSENLIGADSRYSKLRLIRIGFSMPIR